VRKFPHERVLAGSAADHENLHENQAKR
jgi:hypothetical protein